MKIALLGAAGGEVTGSAYLVQTEAANVMVGKNDGIQLFQRVDWGRPLEFSSFSRTAQMARAERWPHASSSSSVCRQRCPRIAR
jgi:hypothetical protein